MSLKALLVGIDAYLEAPLKGCRSDVRRVSAFLTQRDCADAAQRVLVDEAATSAAIEEGLIWLSQVDADEQAPVRLFHFSGHGTFVADTNGDEPDGQDECIVPFDYAAAGPLIDDRLAELYAKFTPETHLLLIMDSCHSGTVDRLPAQDIRFRFLRAPEEEQRRIKAAAAQIRGQRDAFVRDRLRNLVATDEYTYKEQVQALVAEFDRQHFGVDLRAGNVVLLAACRADQMAADAGFGSDYQGAFTYHLLEALAGAGRTISYGALIARVGQALDRSPFDQVPQLSCSAANRECGFLQAPLT